ncbi:MAG: hypothetical protein WC584_03835 [Candidatus Pacearchaeota archaeon]
MIKRDTRALILGSPTKRIVKSKRSQAAMEFLMTYGWAILAAIIVIAVIAIYFRPSTLVQNSVIVNAPLYGVGTTLSATQLQVEVRNQGGEDITTTGAAVTFNSPSGASCAAGTGTGALAAGSTQVVTFGTCTGLSSGNTMSADLAITYTRPDSTLGLQSTGTISGKVA